MDEHCDIFNCDSEGYNDTVLISAVFRIGFRMVRVTFIGYSRATVTAELQAVQESKSKPLKTAFKKRSVVNARSKAKLDKKREKGRKA